MVAIGTAHDGSASSATRQEAEPLLATRSQTPPHDQRKRTDFQAAPVDATQQPLSSSSASFSWAALQLVLVASIVVYVVAYTVFPSPFVQLVVFDRIGQWWTDPANERNGPPIVHFEMERPMALFLSGVLPFAVGTVAFELMRGPQNVHRVVSRHVLRVGVVFRRKPSAYGRLAVLSAFSFGELLFLALLTVGNVVLFVVGWATMLHYYPHPGQAYTAYTTLEIVGVVFGYSCVYNMAFLFLPATRRSAWMEFFAISYANGMKFHRWLGVATVATALGHALPFYPVWYHSGVLWAKAMPCFDCSLDYLSRGYPAWFNVFGEISLVFMLALAATSLPSIRRNMYETFYYAHYLFVPTVVFAVLHWGTIVWWLLPTFTIYLVDRVLGSSTALSPVPIEQFAVLSDGVLKVVVSRSAQRGGDFAVGQFVYMNVPAISKWQWHAFTIGSSPRGPANATSFTVWLKSLGDWTEDLVQYASECEQKREPPVVYVDGYYGTSLESYDQHATLCLVGGGIGVTPLFAMLEDIACRVNDDASDSSRWPRTRRVHFVFTFRELALLEEIHPVLQALRANEQTREIFTLDLFLTRTPNEKTLDTPLVSLRRSTDFGSQQPHRPAKPKAASPPAVCPFAEPLRGRTYRAVLYATVIVGSAAAILYLDYGGGVLMDYGAKTQYWPLQNLADCLAMFAIAPLAYVFIWIEKLVERVKARGRPATGGDSASVQQLSAAVDVPQRCVTTAAAADVSTYRDLLAEYRVAIGERPDMLRVMSHVHRDYCESMAVLNSSVKPVELDAVARTVGVFISGPEALKRATEDAVAAIDTSCFDIHDEEFEL